MSKNSSTTQTHPVEIDPDGPNAPMPINISPKDKVIFTNINTKKTAILNPPDFIQGSRSKLGVFVLQPGESTKPLNVKGKKYFSYFVAAACDSEDGPDLVSRTRAGRIRVS